uniref:Uncharacterized protein n=1 Tax=Triticum urartu TaxID=4572 RepID=A0A8R7QHW5_TRIUA
PGLLTPTSTHRKISPCLSRRDDTSSSASAPPPCPPPPLAGDLRCLGSQDLLRVRIPSMAYVLRQSDPLRHPPLLKVQQWLLLFHFLRITYLVSSISFSSPSLPLLTWFPKISLDLGYEISHSDISCGGFLSPPP